LPQVPVGRLLIAGSHLQQGRFLQCCGLQLQSDRASVGSHSTGHGNSRQAGQIGADGADVAEVHFEGIAELRSECERGRGGSGAGQHIHLLKGGFKIFLNAAPHLQRFQVVSVIVAR